MLKDVLSLLADRYMFFAGLAVEHLWISGVSVIIAGVIGLILGILITEKQSLSPFVIGSTNIVYTIPSISLLGFLIPFTGIGNTTAVVALSVYALLPMVRNTYAGLTGVDNDVLEVAKAMGGTRFQVLYSAKLPLAAPVIMAGLRNMTVMTIALAGIASFVGAGGLGVAVYRGITTNNYAMILAGSLLIAIMAFVADMLFGLADKAMKRRLGL